MEHKTLVRAIVLLLVLLVSLPIVFSLAINSFLPVDTTPTLEIAQTATFDITLDDTSNIIAYTWKVEGIMLQAINQSSFLYTPSTTGTKNIEVNATQAGGASVVQQWTATVINSSVTASILDSPEIAIFGGDSQKVSNPEAEDSDAHNVLVSNQIRIKNNGADLINNITILVSPQSPFKTADINVTFNQPQTTLSGGDTLDISFTVRMSEKLDAINETTFKKFNPQVATITFTGKLPNGTLVSDTTSLNLKRKNQLIITDIDVCVESDCEDVGEGEKVDNILPGDEVTIEIKVENLYSERSDEDVTIEDVEVEYDIDENEFDEDDSERLGDLSARDEETHVFSFIVPDDIDSSVYDVLLTVIGTDDFGAAHGDILEFSLDVDRKSHDIQLDDVSASPSILDQCERKTTTFRVSSRNVGENDEDDVVITVKNQELGINERYGPFLFDEDERRTDTFVLELPDYASPGSYTIIAKSFFDTNKQTDEEGFVLTVNKCSDDKKTTSSNNDDSSPDSSNDDTTTSSSTQTTPVTSDRRVATRTFSEPTTTSNSKITKSSFKDVAPILLAVLIGLVFVMALALVVIKRR